MNSFNVKARVLFILLRSCYDLGVSSEGSSVGNVLVFGLDEFMRMWPPGWYCTLIGKDTQASKLALSCYMWFTEASWDSVELPLAKRPPSNTTLYVCVIPGIKPRALHT